MAIKITLKNSVVQDSVPTTTHLPAVGELAVNANINSLGIYMRASDNTIVKMAGPGSLTTPAASTTVAGISEYATNSETTTGTSTTRSVTPAGLAAVISAERSTSNSTYLALAGGTLTGVLAATAGSNSAASIHFGDTDSGVFGGTNTVSLTAGGTTRLTADTGVSVVGTLAVTGAITSTSDLTIPDKIIHSGDTDTAIRFPAADTVSVEAGGTEALRVDSSRRVLVGLTSSRAIANLTTLQQIEGTDAASGLSITRNSASNAGGTLNFGKSRAAAVGGVTVIQDGDALGTINFSGADGTDLTNTAASIAGFINGTPGANDTPGKLVFGTTADGAASPTTRLTITSAGLVNVPDNGKFTAGASSDLSIYHDGSNSYIEDVGTGVLVIASNQINLENAAKTEYLAKLVEGGAVELNFDNSKKFETTSGGTKTFGTLEIKANEASDCNIYMHADEGDDNADNWLVQAHTDGSWNLKNYTDAAWESNIKAVGSGAVELYHDNSVKLSVNSAGANVTGRLYTSTYVDAVQGIYIPDSYKANFGNSADLKIYHDGGNGFIVNDTGDLYLLTQNSGDDIILEAADDIYLRPQAGEEGIHIQGNGNTSLYHDGAIKCYTVANGFKLHTSNHLELGDSSEARFGNDTDLKIFFNGTNSEIKNATGILYLESDGTTITDKEGSDVMAKFIHDGAVELNFDNSKKIETTNTGATLTGSVIIDKPSGGDSANIDSESLIFKTQSGELGKIICKSQGGGGPSGHGGAMYFHTKVNNGSLAERMILNVDGDLFVQRIYDNTTSGGANVRVQSNGLLQRDTSSRRYKNTIEDATHGLADLNKLRSVTYKGNNDGDTIFGGLIAEEVHDAGLTEFVDYNSDNQPDALRYANMVALCIKAIQELSAKVTALEGA